MEARPQRVLVLGATSAIAAEVALLHAARGARLHLVGRNGAKLAEVAARCSGAEVTTQQADLAALDGCADVVAAALEELGGVDVALIAHGDLGDQIAAEASFEEAERIFRINLLSAVALIVPLANHLEAARGGTLAVISSVAGERGRPRNDTYGAAKGALTLYLQGVRSRLFAAGVVVTTIKLGPVDTPMTVDHAKNLLFATSPRVAAEIVAAIDAGAGEVYVPGFWRAIMPVVRNLPERVFQRLSFLSGR